jgi:hypothetical protein
VCGGEDRYERYTILSKVTFECSQMQRRAAGVVDASDISALTEEKKLQLQTCNNNKQQTTNRQQNRRLSYFSQQ